METSSTKTKDGVTGEQPSAERKGGFIPGALATQGCCGTFGGGVGCCGVPAAATTTVTSAPAAKPDVAPSAAQSSCCGSSASSCCG
jgi:hypothetical protein